MLETVSQKPNLILVEGGDDKDWGPLNRIVEVFKLNTSSSNYADMEAKCFEAVLKACQKRKWALIKVCENDISKITDIAGKTLFMRIVASWDNECVTELLKYKSLVYQKDSGGNTALHIAAQKGSLHLLPLLFQFISFDVVNNAGETPLHTAIFHGQEGVLKTFKENGANINALFIWKTLKMTPLCFSVLRGETGCVDCLLTENNFRQSISGIGNLLHIAIHFHQTHMIEYLLEKPFMHALLEERNDNDMTPLIYAASLGEIEAIWALKKKGADLEVEDSLKRTPLHHAALSSQLEVIKLLASFKVNPQAVDRQGKTPLALAESKKDESFDALETYHLLSNLLNSWGTVNFSRHSTYSSPENLAFKGGGGKGPLYIGVIKFLEIAKKLGQVKRVVGTSSGAITATFVALAYSALEMEEILLSKDLMDFIDDPICKTAIEELNSTEHSQAKTLLDCYQRIKKAIASGNLIYDFFKKMNKKTGMCTGESFRLWMEEEIISTQVAKITGKLVSECKYYTLGDHRKLIQEGKPVKHIKISGTKLGPNLEIVEFSSEDPKYDNYILSDLIRISMSIPELFEGHYIHIRQGKDRVIYKEGGVFVDGGLLDNLPVEAFDQKRYQTQKDLGSEGFCPQFNKKTLGFNLVSSGKVEHLQDPKTMKDILVGIAKAYLSAETTIRDLVPYNRERIVEIDVGDLNTLSFNLDDKQKQAAIQSGFEQTKRFFSKFDNSNSTDSLFSIPEDLEKRIKNRIDLPSRIPHFSGRKGELSTLKKAFITEHWKVSDSLCLKVILGPGGMGKSELAITFGNKYEQNFSLIWFIHCESDALYEQHYRELAEALKIPCGEDPLDHVIRKVNRTLESGIDGKKPWLLIYDNAESTIKRDTLPQRGGCVLVTTQNKTVWNVPSDFIELLPLSVEDCQDFFQQKVQEDPSQAMNDLIEELGGYPILLGLAAQSIYPYQRIQDYLKKVQTSGPPVWEIDEASRYPKALGSIFNMRLQQIQEANPLAFEFLELCAFVSPDYIPVQFLEFWLKLKKSDQEKVSILKALCDNSLFRYNQFKEYLSLHRLQQKMLQKMVKKEKYWEVIRILSEWSCLYNIRDLNTFKIGENCYFLLEELIENPFWKQENPIQKAILLHRCGNWLVEVMSGYPIGLDFYEEALEIYKNTTDKEDKIFCDVVGIYSKIGVCHNRLENYSLSIEFSQKANEEMGDNSHYYTPSLTECYDNVGDCYEKMGEYQIARSYREGFLEYCQAMYGEEHLETALSHNYLASILIKCGLNEEALEHCKKAEKVLLESVGEEHPFVAKNSHLIGSIYLNLKKYDNAASYFATSITIQEKFVLKRDIFETYKGIIEAWRGVIEANPDYPSFIDMELTYANVLLEAQKEILFDENDPLFGESYQRIGAILDKRGRFKEALEAYEKSLGSLKDPFIGFSYQRIGEILNKMGRVKEALEAYEKSLNIFTLEYHKKSFSAYWKKDKQEIEKYREVTDLLKENIQSIELQIKKLKNEGWFSQGTLALGLLAVGIGGFMIFRKRDQ